MLDTPPSDAAGSKYMPISKLMTRHVVCVDEDADLENVTALFLEKGLHGAPVVDHNGKPVGFLATTDLVRGQHETGDTELLDAAESAQLPEGFHAEPRHGAVRDVMMPMVFSLRPFVPVGMAAAVMAYEGVHRLPVVSTTGKVVGILSALDILRWIAKQSGYLMPPVREHA